MIFHSLCPMKYYFEERALCLSSQTDRKNLLLNSCTDKENLDNMPDIVDTQSGKDIDNMPDTVSTQSGSNLDNMPDTVNMLCGSGLNNMADTVNMPCGSGLNNMADTVNMQYESGLNNMADTMNMQCGSGHSSMHDIVNMQGLSDWGNLLDTLNMQCKSNTNMTHIYSDGDSVTLDMLNTICCRKMGFPSSGDSHKMDPSNDTCMDSDQNKLDINRDCEILQHQLPVGSVGQHQTFSEEEMMDMVSSLCDPEFVAQLEHHVELIKQGHTSSQAVSVVATAGGNGFEVVPTRQFAPLRQPYEYNWSAINMEDLTVNKEDIQENLTVQDGEHDNLDLLIATLSVTNMMGHNSTVHDFSVDFSTTTQSAIDLSECSPKSRLVEARGIQVGEAHQAVLPELVGPNGDTSDLERMETLMWDPCRLEEKDTLRYLTEARAINRASTARGVIPTSSWTPGDDFALTTLQQQGYNLQKALDHLRKLGKWNMNPLLTWSKEECQRFVAGLKQYGKNFSAVQQTVKTHTVKEVLHFYYLWKRSEHHGTYEEKKKLANHRNSCYSRYEEEDWETEAVSEMSPWKRPKRERSSSPVRSLMNSRHKPSTPPPDFELQTDQPPLTVAQDVSLVNSAPSSVNSTDISISPNERYNSLSGFVDLCGTKRNCDLDSSLDSSDMFTANGLTDSERNCDLSSSDSSSNMLYSNDLQDSKQKCDLNSSHSSDRINLHGLCDADLERTSSEPEKNSVCDIASSSSSDSVDGPDQLYHVCGVPLSNSAGSTEVSRCGRKRRRGINSYDGYIPQYKIVRIIHSIKRIKRRVSDDSSGCSDLFSSDTDSCNSEMDVSEEEPYEFPVVSSPSGPWCYFALKHK